MLFPADWGGVAAALLTAMTAAAAAVARHTEDCSRSHLGIAEAGEPQQGPRWSPRCYSCEVFQMPFETVFLMAFHFGL